jgi:cell division protein FtsQ
MTSKRDLSRADAARQRRVHENKKRVEQATKRAYRPTPTVPARSRNYASSRTRQIPDQRRFNIALGLLPGVNTRGTTIHIPELRYGPRTVSLVLTFLLLAALYFAWTLPYFHATWATVVGNNRVPADEINAALGVTGQSIFTIQPSKVETRLVMNYPELTSAKVKVYLPNYVYVTVTEREPVILWQQGEGYTWIDSEGVAFRPRGAVAGLIPVIGNGAPPTPIASTSDPLSPTPYMSKEMVDAIKLLAPNLPPGTVMVYDSQNGLGWKDSRGWQAFFGTDGSNMALKLRVYQSLVDSLVARGVTPTIISVEYPDAPFYRVAQTGTEKSNENP